MRLLLIADEPSLRAALVRQPSHRIPSVPGLRALLRI